MNQSEPKKNKNAEQLSTKRKGSDGLTNWKQTQTNKPTNKQRKKNSKWRQINFENVNLIVQERKRGWVETFESDGPTNVRCRLKDSTRSRNGSASFANRTMRKTANRTEIESEVTHVTWKSVNAAWRRWRGGGKSKFIVTGSDDRVRRWRRKWKSKLKRSRSKQAKRAERCECANAFGLTSGIMP